MGWLSAIWMGFRMSVVVDWTYLEGLLGVGRCGVGKLFTVFQFSEAKSVQNVCLTIVKLPT